jgi:hypothetical protein
LCEKPEDLELLLRLPGLSSPGESTVQLYRPAADLLLNRLRIPREQFPRGYAEDRFVRERRFDVGEILVTLVTGHLCVGASDKKREFQLGQARAAAVGP